MMHSTHPASSKRLNASHSAARSLLISDSSAP
nr:MAG TPA: hypothetical protein [Caudoviricetes sp.]